jgi:hypothetical protein
MEIYIIIEKKVIIVKKLIGLKLSFSIDEKVIYIVEFN